MSLDIGLDINPVAPSLASLFTRFPGASIAADFTKEFYYAEGAKSLGQLVTDARDTELVLPGFNDNLVTIPAGQPARTSKGLGVFGSATNGVLHSEAMLQSSWTRRGTVSIIDNAMTFGLVSLSLITGLRTPGVADVFQGVTGLGLSPGAPAEPSFYIQRISTAGTLSVSNPASGSYGFWNVNLALLSNNVERITKNHPAVTATTAFVASPSSGIGVHLLNYGGTPLSFYAGGFQLEPGTVVTPYIRATTAPVTRAASEPALIQNLGPELVTNGDFSDGANGWIRDAGFSVSGGTGQYDGSGAQYAKMRHPVAVEAGETYALSVAVSNLSLGGSFNFGFADGGGGFQSPQATFVENGIATRLMVADGGTANIQIQTNTAAQTFTLDNVSVRKVTPFDGYTSGPQTGRVTASAQVSATKRSLKRWVMNSTDYVELYYSGAGAITLESVTGGVSRGLVSVDGKDDGLDHTITYLFSPTGDLRLAVDSVVPATTTGLTMPASYNTIQLGHGAAMGQMNGFITTFGAVNGDKFDAWR